MKWLSRICVALAAMVAAGSAVAADLAVKAPPRPLDVAYNWSGFYIGGNVGGAWGTFDTSTRTVFSPIGYFDVASVPAVNAIGGQSIKPSNVIGGVQAGYNWQAGRFVAGVEADINSFRLSGSAAATGVYPCCAPASFTVASAASTDWLFFFTGGLALTKLKGNFGFTDNCGNIAACNGPGGPNAFEAASLSKTKLGYTVGAGAEAGLWGNWSLKAEYLYVKFDSESVVSTITTPGLQPFAASNPFTHTVDLAAHIARLGLNYRFGGPVIARY
jgi:outer membrane immunogenic protein